jgi:hypothetical protein
MKKIKLYNDIYIDLVKLIASKLFIYANSGFGKSWLLRWFLEQTFGEIQQIIIDPEGEFSTLREKYDYILIGKGKEFDIQADPRTAALLAHRLLEEKVSAIIDLYEVEPLERERFVANFTTALVNAPKNLWHPYLYVVDEAQDFAPEKGDALSSKPLHSIAKKGRKRGCCPIFATQRVSDFSKAVIAACNNKLIGQASLDIDMKRCAAELGFSTKEQTLSLRDLEPGEFFAFGPAITKIVSKVKIGSVKTTHPDSSKMGGKIGKKVVPASAKVKKALAKLADLPQEAAEEAKTTAELKEALRVAKRRISDLERAPKEIVDLDYTTKAVKTAVDETERRHRIWRDKLYQILLKTHGDMGRAVELFTKFVEEEAGKPGAIRTVGHAKEIVKNIRKHIPHRADEPVGLLVPTDMLPMGAGERQVLIAIAGALGGMTREHITVQTGYKRSTRDAYIQRLAQKGYVVAGDRIAATTEGIAALGDDYQPLPTGQDLIDHHLRKLPEGEAKIFKFLVDPSAQDIWVTRDTLSDAIGYQRSTRDAYIQRLAARQLIEVSSEGVRASRYLFE